MHNTHLGEKELPDPLTRREMEILVHLAQGLSNPEIAQAETLTLGSVKWYVNQILGKLGAANRQEAAARARELGLLKAPQPDAPNNLPLQLSSFIGREREIAQLLKLVLTHPLVTVTGAGGSGKTRLALQTADKALGSFAGGVWWVELAPLADPGQVTRAVLNAFGLADVAGLAPDQRLLQYLRGRQCLLVLDNCEHVAGAAAVLAGALLHGCSRLAVLATSREVLGVEGEVLYRCPSLTLPEEGQSEPGESEAVRLFVERAESVCPGFRLEPGNAQEIAQICRRLDGIPLAIELAAARTRLLSCAQIAALLEDVFHVLSGSSRTGQPRHRTLRAAIEWSYALLSEAEQVLLGRLAVFAGSWNLALAEAVCADPPGGLLPDRDMLDRMGDLLDKSMIEPLAGLPSQGTRYRMLETVRQFALEKLTPAEEQRLRERHLDSCQAFCLEAEPHLVGFEMRAWREKVDAELDNLRRALEWSLGASVEKGLRIVAALWWYWVGRHYNFSEVIGWLERLLETEAAGEEEERRRPERRLARAKALNVLAHQIEEVFGFSETVQNKAREAMEIFAGLGPGCRVDWIVALSTSGQRELTEVLELIRATGDRFYISHILWYLIMDSMKNGDLPQHRLYLEESLENYRQIGYKEGEEVLLRVLAQQEFVEGHLARALELLDESMVCVELAGSQGREKHHLVIRSIIALSQGDYPLALKYILEKHKEEGKDPSSSISGRFVGCGLTTWAAGDLEQAEQYLAQAARSWDLRFRETGHMERQHSYYYVRARITMSRGAFDQAAFFLQQAFGFSWHHRWLQACGVLAAGRAEYRRAALLFGALEPHPWLNNIVSLRERQEYQAALESTRAALDEDAFAALYAEGKALSLEQVLQSALDWLRDIQPAQEEEV